MNQREDIFKETVIHLLLAAIVLLVGNTSVEATYEELPDEVKKLNIVSPDELKNY